MRAIGSLDAIPASASHLFEKLYTLLDRDCNGALDLLEFTSGLSVLCQGEADAKLKLLYVLLDADGSGQISEDELQTFFMTLHAVAKGIKRGIILTPQELSALEGQTQDEIVAIMAEADANSDGSISWGEFHAAMLSSQSSKLRAVLEMFSISRSDLSEQEEGTEEEKEEARSCEVQ